jgi:hypothetical protein
MGGTAAKDKRGRKGVDKIARKKLRKGGNVGSGRRKQAGSVHDWGVKVGVGMGPFADSPVLAEKLKKPPFGQRLRVGRSRARCRLLKADNRDIDPIIEADRRFDLISS